MSNDSKAPKSEVQEPQQIMPQTGELDAEKLDDVVGGTNGAGSAPHPNSVGPQGP